MPVPKPKLPNRPVPLDSVYMSNMAADQYQRANQGAGLIQQNAVDRSDTAEALRRMAMQRTQSQSNYNANAARNGSLLSGRAMHNYGVMDTGYQQRANDVHDQLARRLAQRQQQLAQLQGGALPYEYQQQSQATGRGVENAWNNRLARYLGGVR